MAMMTTTSTDGELAATAAVGSTWQRPEEDVSLREAMAERLVMLFHAKRPGMEDAFKVGLK